MQVLPSLHSVDPTALVYGKGEPAHLLEVNCLTDGTISKKRAVESDNVMSWLGNQPSRETIWDFRLLFVHCEASEAGQLELPFSNESQFDKTLEFMYLAENKQRFLALANPILADRKWNHEMAIDERYDHRSRNPVMILRTWLATQEQTTVMISYRPETNTVSVFGIFADKKWMMELIGKILNERNHSGHPMLIPILMHARNLQYHRMDLDELGEEVKVLETEAGVRDFSFPSNETFIANASKAIRKSTDLKARLTDCGTHVRIMKDSMLEQTLDGLRMINKLMIPDKWACAVIGANFEDRTHSLKLQTIRMLAQIDSLTTKMDTTLPALYNMFVQRDNQLNMQHAHLNIRIAKQSVAIATLAKRDSSSMKSIAVVTTLFLPGTFVATVISMPMVNWERSDLWIYWAITIPLTAFVMSIWALYILIVDARSLRKIEEAEKRLQKEIGNSHLDRVDRDIVQLRFS